MPGVDAPVGFVPYGSGSIPVPPIAGVTWTTVSANRVPILADPVANACERVTQPIGAPPLRELAAGAKSVVIAVTDATRDCPDAIMVPPMLAEIEAAGVPPEAITILVAVGVHRPSTEAERRAKLGDAIVDRYRVVDHDAADDDGLLALPEPVDGLIFRLNRLALEADPQHRAAQAGAEPNLDRGGQPGFDELLCRRRTGGPPQIHNVDHRAHGRRGGIGG